MSNKRLEPLDHATCIDANASVRAAAESMRKEGVGCLVVEDETHAPVGIVTDRDLALRVVAWPQDVDATPISKVMTKPVECLDEDTPPEDVLKRMCALGVRRIPLTRAGRAVRLVSFDDLAQELAVDMGSLSLATASRVARSRRDARRDEIVAEAEEILKALRSRLRFANWYAKECFVRELDDLREKVARALENKSL